jgi:hypothetical protein
MQNNTNKKNQNLETTELSAPVTNDGSSTSEKKSLETLYWGQSQYRHVEAFKQRLNILPQNGDFKRNGQSGSFRNIRQFIDRRSFRIFINFRVIA